MTAENQTVTLLFSGYIFIGMSVPEQIDAAVVEHGSCSLFQDNHKQCPSKHSGNFPTEKAGSWKPSVL